MHGDTSDGATHLGKTRLLIFLTKHITNTIAYANAIPIIDLLSFPHQALLKHSRRTNCLQVNKTLKQIKPSCNDKQF